MAMFQTNACCCCFSLRTGCLVIGWLVCILAAFHYIGQMGESDAEDFYMSKLNFGDDDKHFKTVFSESSGKFTWESTVFLNLVAAILLLIGTYKEKADLLLPWLVLKGLELVGTMIILLVLFFASGLLISDSQKEAGWASSSGDSNVKAGEAALGVVLFTVAAVFGLFVLIDVHFFTVVNSYHTFLKQNSGRKYSTTGGIVLRTNQMV